MEARRLAKANAVVESVGDLARDPQVHTWFTMHLLLVPVCVRAFLASVHA
jgi:hypothetical protein